MSKRKQKPTTKKELRPSQEVDQAAFLAAIVQTGGHVGNSAKMAGINRGNHYDWLKDDPDYEERFNEAVHRACQVIEDEIRRRAINGVRKPVFQGGKRVGYVREYSDTLLIFLAKGAMPGKYRERVEHSGPAGKPIQVEATRLVVVEDANWYGNQDRLTAEAPGTPANGAIESSAVQGS